VGERAWVRTTFKNEEEVFEETELEVRAFVTEPALVRAKYGVTINLGNYESGRVDAEVTIPCYVEEIEPAFERAWEIVKKQVDDKLDKVKGE
jgi:hypothetical protein